MPKLLKIAVKQDFASPKLEMERSIWSPDSALSSAKAWDSFSVEGPSHQVFTGDQWLHPKLVDKKAEWWNAVTWVKECCHGTRSAISPCFRFWGKLWRTCLLLLVAYNRRHCCLLWSCHYRLGQREVYSEIWQLCCSENLPRLDEIRSCAHVRRSASSTAEPSFWNSSISCTWLSSLVISL